MPNLVGHFFPRTGEETSSDRLRRQINAVTASGFPHEESSYVADGVGIAVLDSCLFGKRPLPIRNANGNLIMFLDGEVNNSRELARRHKLDTDCPQASDAETCLLLIDRLGPAVSAEFNGAFVICLYDTDDKSVRLINDRLGIRPVFLKIRERGIVFATELKGVIAGDSETPALDELGILQLFCFKNHILGRTWLEGYERLAPASILEFSAAGLKRTNYFAYRYAESAPRRDLETYSTLYAKLVDRSVERCMQGTKRVGLFLSGGYDSRAIAGAIRSHHPRVPAITFGEPDSRDVIYAAEISERLGFEHTVISRQGAYLYEHAASIAWRTEGMIPFANTTSIAVHSQIKGHIDIILAGFLGEFSGSHVWPGLMAARSRRQAIDSIYSHLAERRLARLARIFNGEFLSRVSEKLRKDFEGSFESIDNDHPINLSDAWNFRYLHPQETYQAPAIDRHLFELRMPLTDNDLVDFLLTIPPTARMEQRIYKRMIAHAYPLLRDVPCTNSGQPIDPVFYREYLKMAARYGLRKLASPLYRLRNQSDLHKREFRNLAQDFREEPKLVTDLLEPMLKADVFPASIFDHAGIESIVSEHYQSRSNHEDILSNLIGWGIAVRALLHGDLSGIDASLIPG